MKLIDKIEAVINNHDFSSYYIEQKTGIQHSKILRLRSGKNKIKDLSIETGMILAKFYDEEAAHKD